MLYALEDRLTSVVGAADTLVEFEAFTQSTNSMIGTAEAVGAKSCEVVSLMELLSEDRFQGFKKCPIIVIHHDEDSKMKFNERFGISPLKRNALLNKHTDMLLAEMENPWAAGASDSRPIEEIHDLIENDNWDKRSDEERKADADYKKAYDDAKKKGEISGDSFGPNPNRKKKVEEEAGTTESSVHVTDVRAHRNADGSIDIDGILAVKGLHDDASAEKNMAPLDADAQAQQATLEKSHTAQQARAREQAEAEAAAREVPIDQTDDENLEIDTQGIVAIYHKVEVTGAKLADIWPVLEAQDIDLNAMAIVQRNAAAGCWFAFLRQLQAEEAAKVLETAGFTVETYAVNDAGERLAPKGVQVVDELREDEQFPRPWNFRSREIGKMKVAEKRENLKTYKPKEFCFVGNYEGAVHGTVIWITPISYFKEKGKMWEKPLNIEHLLPRDFEEVGPGLYRSKSRDWNHISFDLAQRGFRENLLLQIYLNSQ